MRSEQQQRVEQLVKKIALTLVVVFMLFRKKLSLNLVVSPGWLFGRNET